MVEALKELGIELMVSIWSTLDKGYENYNHMLEQGYLVRSEREEQELVWNLKGQLFLLIRLIQKLETIYGM